MIGVIESRRYSSGGLAEGASLFLPERLVALYRLNETTQAEVRDSLGVNHGSNFNVVRGATGVEDLAYNFNDSSSFLTLPNAEDFHFTDGGAKDIPFSIAMWLYPTQIKLAQFFNKEEIDNVEYDVTMLATGQLSVKLSSSLPNFIRVKTTQALVVNQWQHIAVTYDAKKRIEGIKVYINGLLCTTVNDGSTSYGGMKMTESDVVIGRSSYHTQIDNYLGRIDEIAIWKNRELTAEKINEVIAGGLSVVSDNYPEPPVSTAVVPLDGLIAYYKMEEAASDAVQTGTMADSHGAYNGSYNDQWTKQGATGKIGLGYEFLGINPSFVNLPSLPITTAGTINLWVKNRFHTNTTSSKRGFIELTNSNSGSLYPFSDGNIYLDTLSSTRKTIGAGVVADRTVWHMVTVTADVPTNTWKFYQNGTLVFTGTVGTIPMIAVPRIGASKGNIFYDGWMDEISFHNRALTLEEITGMYNEGNGVTLE